MIKMKIKLNHQNQAKQGVKISLEFRIYRKQLFLISNKFYNLKLNSINLSKIFKNQMEFNHKRTFQKEIYGIKMRKKVKKAKIQFNQE